jgi:hypothetical protein
MSVPSERDGDISCPCGIAPHSVTGRVAGRGPEPRPLAEGARRHRRWLGTRSAPEKGTDFASEEESMIETESCLIRREAAAARAALLVAHAAAPGEADLDAVAERVGRAVAEAEPVGARSAWAQRFATALREGRFWPSVPILANAGRGEGAQLAACFVLEPADSLDSIYDTLRRAARIQQGSGGVGIDFSRLRPRGAAIRRSGGVSPGPSPSPSSWPIRRASTPWRGGGKAPTWSC